MLRFTLLLLPSLALETVNALRCFQCNGWQGDYPLSSTVLSTCDNMNNQCQTDYFCVKITDPMRPGVTYATYKADCWTQNKLQVTPTNQTVVSNGECYDYRDNSNPSKRWKYCFCNNADYCNSASLVPKTIAFFLLIFVALLF